MQSNCSVLPFHKKIFKKRFLHDFLQINDKHTIWFRFIHFLLFFILLQDLLSINSLRFGKLLTLRKGITYILTYIVGISVCLFVFWVVFPIITQKSLYRFASNFDWGTRETHRNFLCLILIFLVEWVDFKSENLFSR